MATGESLRPAKTAKAAVHGNPLYGAVSVVITFYGPYLEAEALKGDGRPMLSVRIIDDQVPIVVVKGKIRADNKNEIEEAINLALAPNVNQLILDVTGVESLDSGEVQAMIEATHRTLGRGGRLALVVSEKDEEHALREARVEDTPGVFVFRDRNQAMEYLAERGYGVG